MDTDTDLHEQLRRAALARRMIFLAGVPGTGKTFFVHRLAHLAHAAGRTVHLLQWDVARPVFESTPAGRRYPMRRGITHPVIRKAAGIWARRALAQWAQRFPDPSHLLIGETPLVGNRLVELARRADDTAEPLLAAASCLFIVPVPSPDVRRFLEAERTRRMNRTAHDREREDAPPNVLRELWEELAGVARRLDGDAIRQAARDAYDPGVYERVYRHVLVHRRMEIITVERPMPDGPVSVYEFGFSTSDVVPTPEEAAGFIQAVEARYLDPEELEREMSRWYAV